jgi:hypothetical protein
VDVHDPVWKPVDQCLPDDSHESGQDNKPDAAFLKFIGNMGVIGIPVRIITGLENSVMFAGKYPVSMLSMIDWKFEPLPEARIPKTKPVDIFFLPYN